VLKELLLLMVAARKAPAKQARAPRCAMLSLIYGNDGARKAHIPYVLESWRVNAPLFDFFIATPVADLNTSYAAPNINFVLRSRSELERAITDVLGIPGQKLSTHWLPSTLSPALASLFEALNVSLNGYSHWGFIDVRPHLPMEPNGAPREPYAETPVCSQTDVILGNLTHFFGPQMEPRVVNSSLTYPFDVLTVYGYPDLDVLSKDRWGALTFRFRRPNPFGWIW
jgi:hypothetical protein